MIDAVKTILGQFASNAKKAPGWVPLLVTLYLCVLLLHENTLVLGIPIIEHKELLVTATAFLLYLIGDALDKAIFRRFQPRYLNNFRKTAQTALGMDVGYYEVAKSLAVAAKKYDGSWIQVKNESSKFLRSLIIPLFIAGVILFYNCFLTWGLSAFAGIIFFSYAYINLKAWHMCDLYKLTQKLTEHNKYKSYDLPTGIRMFFWEGALVSSGLLSESLSERG